MQPGAGLLEFHTLYFVSTVSDLELEFAGTTSSSMTFHPVPESAQSCSSYVAWGTTVSSMLSALPAQSSAWPPGFIPAQNVQFV